MDTEASWNLTKVETLELIRQKTLEEMAPSVAYLAFMCLLGLIGNSLVLFVYSRKFTRSPTRVFILAIAGFDLFTNLLVIPGEMYTLLHWWEKGSDLFCKILMYLGAQSLIVAELLLVAVAFARLSKSTRGDKQQLRDVRQICIVIAVASLVFSVPYAVVNGKRKKPNLPEDVSGYQCGADDSYPPVLSTAFAGLLILLFAVCVVPTMVLYCIVCCQIWRRRRVYVVGADKTGMTHHNGKEVAEDAKGGSLPVVTSRSRSYIKKKPDDEKQASSGNAMDKAITGGGVKVEDNVIELVEDDKPEDGDARLFEARMIRSPTGDKVTVNLSMVRELTVKLKAVQKQAEERLAKGGEQTEDVFDGTSDNNNDVPVKSDEMGQKKSPSSNDAIKTEQKEASNNDLRDNPNETNQKETQSEVNQGVNAGFTDDHSSSVNQINEHTLTTEETTDNALKQASNSDQNQAQLIVNEGLTSETDIGESTEVTIRKGERENAEATKEADDMQDSSLYIPSDFAKAMQWVEITYCQRTDPRPSDADDDISNVDPASLVKKGSFMSSRKVSRDNSFLRKHRKLRDALTDTLTRARKSKKDRDERNGSCPDVSDKQNDRISEDVNDTDSFNVNDTSTDPEFNTRLRKATVDNCDVITGIPEDCPRVNEQDPRDSKRGLGATTWMLLIVSLIYIISSLPYLALNFIRSQSPDATYDQTGETLYNVFIRAHFLNSAVKPVVYVICNVKFRHQSWKALKRC